MNRVYRAGQLVNVFLLGALLGVSLYSAIRNAEDREAERARVRVRQARPRSAPVQVATRGIDSPLSCGWASVDHAKAMGW